MQHIDYPAITICSHGSIQEIIDSATRKQFEDYVLDTTGKNVSDFSKADQESLKKNYTRDFYPGSNISPENLINTLTASDPDKTLNSKLITNPKSICINSPFTCESPWFSPLPSITYDKTYGSDYDLNCIANLDQGKAIEKKCEKIGGQNIFFDSFGNGGGKAMGTLKILLQRGIPTVIKGPSDAGGSCPAPSNGYINSNGKEICCCAPQCCWQNCRKDEPPESCLEGVSDAKWEYNNDLNYYEAKKGGINKIIFE